MKPLSFGFEVIIKPFTSTRFASSSSAARPEDDGFSMSSAPHLAHVNAFTRVSIASILFHRLPTNHYRSQHHTFPQWTWRVEEHLISQWMWSFCVLKSAVICLNWSSNPRMRPRNCKPVNLLTGLTCTGKTQHIKVAFHTVCKVFECDPERW